MSEEEKEKEEDDKLELAQKETHDSGFRGELAFKPTQTVQGTKVSLQNPYILSGLCPGFGLNSHLVSDLCLALSLNSHLLSGLYIGLGSNSHLLLGLWLG
jgi:hypothetical protein